MKEKIINYIETLEAKSLQVDDYFRQRNELYISNQEKEQEIKRLNNIINELKEWFKGYHKSYASCKWYEEDYIEFIEHLEKELKGSDK